MQILSKIVRPILFLAPLFWQGCQVAEKQPSYTKSEIFSIVHTVLYSQQALSRAALITSEGIDTLEPPSRSRTLYNQTYLCQEGVAYVAFYDNDSSLDFSPTDRMEIEYHHCNPYQNEEEEKIDGLLTIEYDHHSEESEYRSIDYFVTYTKTRVRTRKGEWELDGSVGVRYTQNFREDTISLLLNTTELSLRWEGEKQMEFGDTHLDFSIHTGDLFYRYRYEGTLHDRLLGSFGFDTSLPFEGYGASNPSRGEMRIVGENLTILLYLWEGGGIHLDVTYPQTQRKLSYETDWNALGF